MTTEALNGLYQACADAFAAADAGDAKRMVFGEGLAKSPALMLIGEAPGEQETLQGKPFVGKAGKNLTAFLEAIGLSRAELYISNVVKIRPTRQSAAGRTVNRPPTRAEIAFFTPWLYREIALVRPRTLVTLGNVALGAFLKGATIGNNHGRWQNADASLPGEPAAAYPLFALYHPASVIYNRSLTEVYQADLLTLKRTLAHTGARADG